MRLMMIFAGAAALAASFGGCASSGYDDWARACQRDYERNRAAATAAGAVIGAGAGAAVAKDDAVGAAVGAAAGAAVANQLAKKDDPCGYGFGGYPYDHRYGYWDEGTGAWRR